MSLPRKAIWLVPVLIGLIGTALIFFVQEPSFQGKSLSRWLAEFNSIPPEKPAPEVSRAIRSIGPSAVPYLLAYIWSDEPEQISLMRKWVNRTLHRSYRSRIDLCAPSWRALSILGPNATSALPEISRHARQGPFQGRAMIALAALGKPPRRVSLAIAAALLGWCALLPFRYARHPGRSDVEERSAQVARGLDLRARGVRSAAITPCEFEHFALIAAWGAPERARVHPATHRAPTASCPDVDESAAQ